MRQLCRERTTLNEADLQELVLQAERICTNQTYPDADVFIDVLDEVTGDAFVAFQRAPLSQKSLYSKNIMGEVAERKNEPAVYRTFETSLNSVGLLARSQEDVMLRQKAYPIRNNRQNIGVLIVEDAIDDQMKDSLVEKEAHGQPQATQVKNNFKNFVVDNIEEGILVFNSKGYLVQMNKVATIYYHRFGYLEDILGMHYDNLSLDLSTFEQLLYLKFKENEQESMEQEIKFDHSYFQMKYIFSDQEDIVTIILRDITEVKRKEAEINNTATVIQEIHHRVKNNLQSVVSLLRIQARRCVTEEAKKALSESVSRIMAIARTHELLSKQAEDDILLKEVLDSVIENMQRCYEDLYHIQMSKAIDEQLILRSDDVVTIALIVNELIQNCYDHAFIDKEQGKIWINVYVEGQYVHISIKDDGTGYDVQNEHQNNLGLQIVTSYVKEKLKGKLTIRSDATGTETAFYFRKMK